MTANMTLNEMPKCDRNTWPYALHDLISMDESKTGVSCAYCSKGVEKGGDQAAIAFCGHIFHTKCLLSIEENCKKSETRYFVCPVCKMENFYPDCGCPITVQSLPWTMEEGFKVGLTGTEGGMIYGNCLDHEKWYVLRDVCESARKQEGLPKTKPFRLYATDGKLICWMSNLGFCFGKGGDSLRFNPKVKLDKALVRGMWPDRDDAWTSYNALAELPLKVTIRVLPERQNNITDSPCWTCGQPDCTGVTV